MKSRTLVVYALAAASLGVSSLSFAQGGRFEPAHMQRVDDRRDDRRMVLVRRQRRRFSGRPARRR